LTEIKFINKTPTAIHYDSRHGKCHHAMRSHKSLSTVGQNECTIYFIKFSLTLQIFKEISTLIGMFVPLARSCIVKEEFVYY